MDGHESDQQKVCGGQSKRCRGGGQPSDAGVGTLEWGGVKKGESGRWCGSNKGLRTHKAREPFMMAPRLGKDPRDKFKVRAR